MTNFNDNPFKHLLRKLEIDQQTYRYFDVSQIDPQSYEQLPFSIRVLLESAVRSCDEFQIKKDHVRHILDWKTNQSKFIEVPFKPSRVILQDFTGVPALVDFAVMRDAYKSLGGDPFHINPLCPTDLVIDHSVQVDYSRTVLSSLKGKSTDTSRVTSQAEIIKNPNTTALCGDCAPSGRCLLNEQLEQNSNSAKKGPIVIRGQPPRKLSSTSTKSPSEKANEPINDVENWIPHNLPKLKHETCPFHQIRSVGAASLQKNQDLEFERNRERFEFLKWSAKSLKNMLIVPPGSGIVHQVNLEFLARVVFENEDRLLYPDSLVGADSHTTMINGLGILGWGVGGIEAEAVMLGQSITLVLPEVIGYKLTGKLPDFATSTDVVLTITKHLRTLGVVGKFVEFFGPGVSELSIADRATIANMCPEYGATIGFFPCDEKSIQYLRQTGRDDHKIRYIKEYLHRTKLFRNYSDSSEDPSFTSIAELDLSTVTPSASGPKRPQDRIPITEMKNDFNQCLRNKISFKGYDIKPDKLNIAIPFTFDGKTYKLRHGSVVISAITSCTNTSNPSVMLGAGLLAKKAVEAGLDVAPYIKTSISPGSGVVTYYLNESGVTPYLEKLGFDIVGYGCMTCIGNSGPLPDEVVEAIDKGDLIAVGILSGNRNFEGRVHPNTRANYLASPLLVVAYALAGTVDIDFANEPIGTNKQGEKVYLKDIWPSRDEIQEVEQKFVIPAMFKEVYSKIQKGNQKWNRLDANESMFYKWNSDSTYIKRPTFFDSMKLQPEPIQPIRNARVLLLLGDSVTTDHISPAGSISKSSEAASYLMSKGVLPKDFNSYGSRRGNDAIMVRGTFANIRIVNRLVHKVGPKTIHFPTNDEVSIFEASIRYKKENTPLIVIAGKDYGSGSSRDWAAKGPYLLGVRAVIAESFERIHRSNLIGMGIVPLQFEEGQSASSLNLSGKEVYTIDLLEHLQPKDKVTVTTNDGKQFQVICRFDTDIEMTYFRHGGILHFMLRQMLRNSSETPN